MIIRIIWQSLKKIHRSIFEYFSDKVISALLKNGTVKFLKNLHISLTTKKLFFQIKLLNDNNFFLIIIFILVKFKMFIYSPWKFVWSTNIQNALPLVYWPPHGIVIDHSSIGLKRLTIQLVFNEAWLCVVLRFLRHNMSQVCTATLSNSMNDYSPRCRWRSCEACIRAACWGRRSRPASPSPRPGAAPTRRTTNRWTGRDPAAIDPSSSYSCRCCCFRCCHHCCCCLRFSPQKKLYDTVLFPRRIKSIWIPL